MPRSKFRQWIILAVMSGFLVQYRDLSAQEVEVPIDVQFRLLLKVLTFNRNLNVRSGGEFTIAVFYQRKYRQSNDVMQDLLTLFSERGAALAVGKVPCRILPVDISTETDLKDILRGGKVDLIYLAPLRGEDIRDFVRLGVEEKVLTASAVSAYVQTGICLGIGQFSGKPRILINLNSMKPCGADFSSKLLSIATVIP